MVVIFICIFINLYMIVSCRQLLFGELVRMYEYVAANLGEVCFCVLCALVFTLALRWVYECCRY